jgi:hypothetical protein
VRALAVTTAKKSSAFPDLPTMTSLYPGFESDNWYAMFLPAGTPQPIVDKLNAEIKKAVNAKDIAEFMAREALDVVVSSPEELQANFKREIARYEKVIRAGNITAAIGRARDAPRRHLIAPVPSTLSAQEALEPSAGTAASMNEPVLAVAFTAVSCCAASCSSSSASAITSGADRRRVADHPARVLADELWIALHDRRRLRLELGILASMLRAAARHASTT